MTKREELVALADEFDDIAVDADGKCYWCDVANAQTHLRAQLHRFTAQASVAPAEREAKLRDDTIEECARELEQSYPDHAWLNAACAAIRALSSRDDGEAKSSDGGVEGHASEKPRCLASGTEDGDWPSSSVLGEAAGIKPGPSEAPSTICADDGTIKREALKAASSIELGDPDTTYYARYGGERIKRYSVDQIVEFANRRVAAAISRIDVPGKTAVKVKPLEWRDHRPDSFPEPAWSAQTPFGFYNIEEVCASDSPAYVVRLHAHHFIADKDDLADAKSAAQADYETRIKSALDIEAQGVPASVEALRDFIYVRQPCYSGDLARALLDKYSIRSAMMTEGE